MVEFSLQGKVAFITGAARGIGRSIAIAMADHGADLALLDLRVEELAQTQKQIEALGRRVVSIECDVTNASGIEASVARTLEMLGGLDIIVNNAGISLDKTKLVDLEEAAWDMVVATNLKSAYLVCRAAGPHLLRQTQGSVINISSMSGIRGDAENASYSAAKWGIIGLTRTLAKEWAPFGVRVNAISPGAIRTDIWGSPSEELVGTISGLIPMGRWGKPDECAGAAVFLASDAASYVTGTNVLIDGGWSA